MDTEAENPKPRCNIRRIIDIFLILLATLYVITLISPMVIRSGSDRSGIRETVFNARRIGLALMEFENEYGAFPNEETRVLVEKKHGTAIPLEGKSSNALFRQLFAAGFTQSEAMFYTKSQGKRKPDGNITLGELLKKGEVGFGYIAGLSMDGNPARPIVFCPIIPGTDRFDPKPFDGKAVILRLDNSATTLVIDKNGHAFSGGSNILSPDNPVWKGRAPDIRYPEL